MKSIVISFNENNKIERLIALLKKLRIPFAIQEVEKTDINDPDIAWDWADIDEKAFAKISEPAFAKDWNNQTDAIWDTL